jgi:hypothetical protein
MVSSVPAIGGAGLWENELNKTTNKTTAALPSESLVECFFSHAGFRLGHPFLQGAVLIELPIL